MGMKMAEFDVEKLREWVADEGPVTRELVFGACAEIEALRARLSESEKLSEKRERLLELLRVRAYQTGWMENLMDCLGEALSPDPGKESADEERPGRELIDEAEYW